MSANWGSWSSGTAWTPQKARTHKLVLMGYKSVSMGLMVGKYMIDVTC